MCDLDERLYVASKVVQGWYNVRRPGCPGTSRLELWTRRKLSACLVVELNMVSEDPSLIRLTVKLRLLDRST